MLVDEHLVPAPQQRNQRTFVSNSMTLGRINGIHIGLHWSVAIFATFVAYNLASFFFPEFAPGFGSLTYALAGFTAAGLLAGSILAHELGHATTALRRGIGVDGITLWLLGGVARMDAQANKPMDAFAIAAAGPAVSVAIAVGAAGGAIGGSLLGVSSLIVATLGYLAVVNAGLALFNLIPALPLDGGRILQAWKWHKGGDREVATVDAAKIGRLFGFALVGAGLLQLFGGLGNGFFTVMIGFFVASRAKAEGRQAERMIAMRNRSTAPPLLQMLGRLFGGPSQAAPIPVASTPVRDESPVFVQARRIVEPR